MVVPAGAVNVIIYGPVVPVAEIADVKLVTPDAVIAASTDVLIALPAVVPYTISIRAVFLPLIDRLLPAADALIDVLVCVQSITGVHLAVKVEVPPDAVIETKGTSEKMTTVNVVVPVMETDSKPSLHASTPTVANAAIIASRTLVAPETAAGNVITVEAPSIVTVTADTVLAAVYVVVYSQVLALSPQQGESAV